MYTENKSITVLTFKKELINCNLDEKIYSLLCRNFTSSNCCLLSFLCVRVALLKNSLWKCTPPFQMGGVLLHSLTSGKVKSLFVTCMLIKKPENSNFVKKTENLTSLNNLNII